MNRQVYGRVRLLNRQNATGAVRLRQKERAKKEIIYAHDVRIVPFGGAHRAYGVLAVQKSPPETKL